MSDWELNDVYGLVADLRAENKRLQQNIETLEQERADLRGMGHADLQTLGNGRDYALAAYMLRDSATTKRADLGNLCRALAESGNVSRGDWEGLRKFWWAAALREAEKEPEWHLNTSDPDSETLREAEETKPVHICGDPNSACDMDCMERAALGEADGWAR